jgi:hypothetical protein
VNFDIFNNDAFALSGLTAAINDAPYIPSRLAQLGWFQSSGMTTTTTMIERKGMTLALVPSMPRGAPATPKSVTKGTMFPIAAVHLPQRAHVNADEVQNVRAFGTMNELMTAQSLVQEKLNVLRQDLDITLEVQRVGAMKGIVYDANGTDVLWDFFTLFGYTQQVFSMELDQTTTDVRSMCTAARRLVEAKLGAKPYTSLRAICSSGFFDAFIGNADVKKTYEQFQGGAWLRTDLGASQKGPGGFYYGDIWWEEYRGNINGTAMIETNCAYLVPEGVPGLFISKFAPADYMETVNTMGLPYYAKMERERFDKGVEIESQSNPLIVNTQPDAVVKLTLT